MESGYGTAQGSSHSPVGFTYIITDSPPLQAVHHQIQKDSELLDMVEELRTAFDFSTEASQLNTSTTMLKEKVKDLLRETVKCSRFVQEYARRDFLGTCVTPS